MVAVVVVVVVAAVAVVGVVAAVVGVVVCDRYSEWGMRGWLGSLPLVGSGVFGRSLLMARWIDSKLYSLFPYIEY